MGYERILLIQSPIDTGCILTYRPTYFMAALSQFPTKKNVQPSFRTSKQVLLILDYGYIPSLVFCFQNPGSGGTSGSRAATLTNKLPNPDKAMITNTQGAISMTRSVAARQRDVQHEMSCLCVCEQWSRLTSTCMYYGSDEPRQNWKRAHYPLASSREEDW